MSFDKVLCVLKRVAALHTIQAILFICRIVSRFRSMPTNLLSFFIRHTLILILAVILYPIQISVFQFSYFLSNNGSIFGTIVVRVFFVFMIGVRVWRLNVNINITLVILFGLVKLSMSESLLFKLSYNIYSSS